MTNGKLIFSALIVKGFSSVIIQTLLIRELLIVFYGNELIFSLILAIWLLSGAFGSTLFANLFKKSKNPVNIYCLAQILLSSFMLVSLVLIRTSKIWLGVALGETFNLNQAVILIIVSLSILALLDGAMFRIGFGMVSSMSKIYLLESTGALIGGLSLTFIMLKYFNAFQIIFILTGLNILLAALILNREKNIILKILGWVILLNLLASYPQWLTLQKTTLALQWPQKNIVAYENSVYGNIVATKEHKQFTVFYNGLPALSLPTPESYFTEDFIHLPLLTKEKLNNILFVGHAVGGLLYETLKYPVSRIVYAELDPLLIKTISSLHDELSNSELKDPRVHIQLSDGRNFIKKTNEKFDAVFINTDIPTSLSLNRYATKEFFQEIRSTLSPYGIAVFKTWGSLSTLSRELKHVNISLLNTLETVFSFIEVIPGDGFNIFIASNQKIILDPGLMSKNYEALGLKTFLINPSYLELRLSPSYRNWFYDSIKAEKNNISVNEDLKPAGLYSGLSLTYSQFSKKIPKIFNAFKSINPLAIILSIVIFFVIWRFIKPRSRILALNFVVFSAGFFSMSMQIIILFLFQSLLGYLFQWLALLTASFMAGIALGTVYADKNKKQLSNTKTISLMEYAFPTAILLGLAFIIAWPTITLGWFLAVLSVVLGIFLGIELPTVYALYHAVPDSAAQTAGKVYCLDLIGACLGAIITPLILIPGCGILATSLILCLIKWGSGWNMARLQST